MTSDSIILGAIVACLLACCRGINTKAQGHANETLTANKVRKSNKQLQNVLSVSEQQGNKLFLKRHHVLRRLLGLFVCSFERATEAKDAVDFGLTGKHLKQGITISGPNRINEACSI